MTVKPGDSSRLNKVYGISTMVTGTTEELTAFNKPLPSGTAVYNSDTRELKISDGTHAPSTLVDHVHNAYAPRVHSHLYGTNIPWHVANPKLWLTDDLANHPELVALDGSELTDEEGQDLALVYPGSTLITPKIESMQGGGFANGLLKLSVSSAIGDYYGSNIFNDEITLSNFANSRDQWLTGATDLDAEQTVTIEFTGAWTYRPTSYMIVPAAGTSELIYARRPTPKHWVIEGLKDDAWNTISEVTDYTDWLPFTAREFKIEGLEVYTKIRLRIIEWNAGDEISEDTTVTTSLYTGLRRFWVFGRKTDTFHLPNIESPHPSFSWVVPRTPFNTGLKHEDVGDIGTTAVAAINLPSYRLPTDGRQVHQEVYSLLHAAIGFTYDPEYTPDSATTSSGVVDPAGSWTVDGYDPDVAAFVEYAITEDTLLSSYTIKLSETQAHPSTWTVEVQKADGTWMTCDSHEDVSIEDFNNVGGTFHLMNLKDVDYTDPVTKMRLNILAWHEERSALGYESITFYAHPKGLFYLPNVSLSNMTTYIVANNTADDVSADVIQRLQQNVIELAQSLSDLQNQVTEHDVTIPKPEDDA